MLTACIACFVIGIMLLLVILIFILFCILTQDVDPEHLLAMIFVGIIGAVTLTIGIFLNIDGNKAYDNVSRIYSLQASEHFELGVGGGNYYYSIKGEKGQIEIEKVPVVKTTLIQDDNIEYPYLLDHKVKWENNEYFLYIPENTKIIQYIIK